jgi:uncharacterized protein YifN (PemK superfamily)
MLKIRKVVVISPTTSHRRKLCTVVPISSTAPDHEEDWHYLLRTNPTPSDGYLQLWVKCDMIYTVSFERLDRLHRKTRRSGREYFVPNLDSGDLSGVKTAVKAYLPF